MAFLRLPPVFYTTPPEPTFTCKYGPKTMQKMSVRIPDGKGPFPLLYTIHGGQWRKEYSLKQLEYICADLQVHGIGTVNIEFRRVGHVDGGYPNTFIDLHEAIRYIDNYYGSIFNREKIGILGHSSGGHLAFCLKHINPTGIFNNINNIKLYIGLAPVLDIAACSHKMQIISRDLFKHPIHAITSPIDYGIGDERQKLFVGERDKLAPQAKDYNAKYPKSELHVLPKASHFTVIDPTTNTWAIIRAHIKKELGN